MEEADRRFPGLHPFAPEKNDYRLYEKGRSLLKDLSVILDAPQELVALHAAIIASELVPAGGE
jgi:hypothetical protein